VALLSALAIDEALGSPEGCGDVPLTFGLIVIVVDRDHGAIGPLHSTRVANVVVATIGAQNDLVAPRRAVITVELGAYAKRPTSR